VGDERERKIKNHSLNRLKGLQASGLFCEVTKLEGLEEIAYFMNWSESKLRRKLGELQTAGVVFMDMSGTPPRRTWCSFPSLLLRYCSLKGEKREPL
jgi:hypothetical protein